MGQHVWLLVATIGTELLAIRKWSKDQFPEPLPQHIKVAWALGAFLLVLYPTVHVRLSKPDKLYGNGLANGRTSISAVWGAQHTKVPAPRVSESQVESAMTLLEGGTEPGDALAGSP